LVKYCALTTDSWTSRQTLGYIAVTYHWIDDLWKLCSFVLATKEMHKDHTAGNVTDELKLITDECNVTKKVVAVVTDNAANIVKHIPCFAHTLNLIVQGSLKDDPVMDDVSKKCRDIVILCLIV